MLYLKRGNIKRRFLKHVLFRFGMVDTNDRRIKGIMSGLNIVMDSLGIPATQEETALIKREEGLKI